MNIDQFAKLSNEMQVDRTISVNDLSELNEKTLLFGYMTNRDTFHVYLRNGLLHKVIYSYNSDEAHTYESGKTLNLEGITPNKRLYPEKCDLEFCSLLTKAGVYLPFTTFTEGDVQKTFYGQVVQSGKKLSAWVSKK